jgi:hypothetical protein
MADQEPFFSSLPMQRTRWDCMACSVATITGLPYEEMPWDVTNDTSDDEFTRRWTAWADDHGLKLKHHLSHLPVHRYWWIADIEVEGHLHAVVMHGDALFHDPSGRRTEIDLSEIRSATSVGTPVDIATLWDGLLPEDFVPVINPLVEAAS